MFTFCDFRILTEEVLTGSLTVYATEEAFYLHLALQLHQAVEHSLRTWRATRDEHIDRNDFVDTLHYVVRVAERTAGNGATTNCNHIFRFSQLLIKTTEYRRHTVNDCTGHHHKVGLTWT